MATGPAFAMHVYDVSLESYNAVFYFARKRMCKKLILCAHIMLLSFCHYVYAEISMAVGPVHGSSPEVPQDIYISGTPVVGEPITIFASGYIDQDNDAQDHDTPFEYEWYSGENDILLGGSNSFVASSVGSIYVRVRANAISGYPLDTRKGRWSSFFVIDVRSNGINLKLGCKNAYVTLPNMTYTCPLTKEIADENKITYQALQVENAKVYVRMNYFAALQYCASLETNGHGDWRLPTVEDLAILYSSQLGGANGSGMATQHGWPINLQNYWTSTSGNNGHEYYNLSWGGAANYDDIYDYAYVSCVRNN